MSGLDRGAAWKQRRGPAAVQRRLAGGGEILQHVALLLAQRGAHRHQALDEAATVGAVRTEAALAPQHPVPKSPLGGVIPRPDLCRVDRPRRRPTASGLRDQPALQYAA